MIGLAIALVGVDGMSGGQPELFDGINIVVITVGLLALGEVIAVAARRGTRQDTELIPSGGRLWLSREEFRLALPAWLRGTTIGVPFATDARSRQAPGPYPATRTREAGGAWPGRGAPRHAGLAARAEPAATRRPLPTRRADGTGPQAREATGPDRPSRHQRRAGPRAHQPGAPSNRQAARAEPTATRRPGHRGRQATAGPRAHQPGVPLDQQPGD